MPLEELTEFGGVPQPSWARIYAKKVGSIIYPSVITRPDIARAASKLAEFLKNPGPEHLRAVDHCIHYLQETKYYIIKYSQEEETTTSIINNPLVFNNSADASYVNNPNRRSGKGYTFKLFGGVIN